MAWFDCMKVIPKKALWQVPALLAIAALLGLMVNQWRDDKLALLGSWSAEQRFTSAAAQTVIISLSEAQRLAANAKAVFLDARSPGDYITGHIEGALNFPAQELDHHFMLFAGRLEAAETVVTYCDGESCDLSHTVALYLQEMGFKDVRILVNGWSVWRQAGLAVKAGGR